MDAAVIGAGIGGLAAGIALRAAGVSVLVYESDERLRPVGAGLSIWPNGVKALRALGLGQIAADAPRGGGALRRADGTELAAFDPDTIADRYGAPLVALDRGVLHAALLAGLGQDRLRMGTRAIGLDEDVVRFADGSEARPALVVGADGLRSVVREQLLRDGEPADSGIVAFRGLSDWSGPVSPGEWWGKRSIAGLLPLASGAVYWYLAARGEPDPDLLVDRLTEYGPPLPAIAARTAPADVLCHRLYDRPPAQRWSDGAATLLGDAAHPMLPFLGQGACSALEDAVALGGAVAASADIRAALVEYERRRVGRTASLVRDSRRAASVALLGSRLARRLRDAVVGHAPESVRLRQLDAAVGR